MSMLKGRVCGFAKRIGYARPGRVQVNTHYGTEHALLAIIRKPSVLLSLCCHSRYNSLLVEQRLAVEPTLPESPRSTVFPIRHPRNRDVERAHKSER